MLLLRRPNIKLIPSRNRYMSNNLSAASASPADKFKALFTSGLHNPVATVLAAFTAISLFFPLIEIPFFGTASMVSDGPGKLLLLMLVVLAVGFYGGLNSIYIKIFAAVTLAFMLFQLYELFSGLQQGSDLLGMFGGERARNVSVFDLLSWGAYVNTIAAIALAVVTFTTKSQQNKDTF